MIELTENQYYKTYRAKRAKRKGMKVPISPERFIRNEVN